jgi:hypothetical protein
MTNLIYTKNAWKFYILNSSTCILGVILDDIIGTHGVFHPFHNVFELIPEGSYGIDCVLVITCFTAALIMLAFKRALFSCQTSWRFWLKATPRWKWWMLMWHLWPIHLLSSLYVGFSCRNIDLHVYVFLDRVHFLHFWNCKFVINWVRYVIIWPVTQSRGVCWECDMPDMVIHAMRSLSGSWNTNQLIFHIGS